MVNVVVVGHANQEAYDFTDVGLIDGVRVVPANENPPMVVTLVGIVTEVSPEHPEKTESANSDDNN